MATYRASPMRKAALMALLAVSTRAGAQERYIPLRQPMLRSLHHSKDPREPVPELYVAGHRVTTLRFETPCDPSQTKLLGWEGRFEPLIVSGRSVVLVPLQDLAAEDRFMLMVTLTDGTSLPFTVMAGTHNVDAQVNVFPDRQSPEALRTALEETSAQNKALREENQRRHQEETSADHALAALLASGNVALTPFKERRTWLVRDEGIEVHALTFDGNGRVAVLFQLKNVDAERPWGLAHTRLSSLTTLESKPFALRMMPAVLPPGSSGRIAIVTDESSFHTKKGPDKLVLELFRDDGLRQVSIVLELRPKR